ncbi:MAG: hypothetical protein JJE35_05805 [Thermoleophilia bacterium]|nr:hypothetical protein [Thermoleophilia bacterium]
MRTLGRSFGLAAIAIAAFVMPATATAEPAVPPENSAATQYTEAIPTGGGRQDAGKGGDGENPTPADVLGARNAQKLNQHGPEGRAAAEVAAETAPSFEAVATEPAAETRPERSHQEPSATGRGDTKKAKTDPPVAPEVKPLPEPIGEPSMFADTRGASGLGEVLGQATGSSSSGQLSVLFPLLILATIFWSLLFAWRQRRRAV